MIMIMIMAHFSRSSMQRLLYYSTPSFHLRHLSTELPRNIWVTSGSIDPTEKLMPCMIRHTYKSSSTATFHRLSPERLRNVWISGLLDPSKLLLTERRLLYTGEIDKMEDARCEIEKKDNNTESYIKQESWLKLGLGKGVISRTVLNWVFNPKSDSIPADLTFFDWRDNYKMTVIDTPDHVDFTPEVQNALRAFDGAVFVLDSVDGVQSHSIVVNKQMVTYQLPRLVFINNLDQKGANPWEVVNQARLKLQHHIAAVQVPIGLEYNFKGLVDLVQLKSYYFHGPNGSVSETFSFYAGVYSSNYSIVSYCRIMVVIEEVPADMEALVLEKRHELIKTVSDVDDKLAEAFCSGKPISAADLQEAIRRATIARKFIPFFMGSAFKYKVTCTPHPPTHPSRLLFFILTH
ncbi:putative P-loop containing nucleoside triphosphate hydrolase [Medicago truncatula]|uniref:Putative P-loop containing nucleoside triphosphate hydrolase n=1 Tax=Medicago truncatula TaxID=3880 RepID=A0A396J8C6_MEDTR|nr:putative P-loop containing nucleoside triphosphate hydrolase [Medicago truncatula]